MALDSNDPHEANRRYWNERTDLWEERSDREGRWSRCHEEPDLAFEGGALQLIQEVSGGVCNKRVCVIGSGDNMAAFALAGLGGSSHVDRHFGKAVGDRLAQGGIAPVVHLVRPGGFGRHGVVGRFQLRTSYARPTASLSGYPTWKRSSAKSPESSSRAAATCSSTSTPFNAPGRNRRTPVEMEKPYWATGPFRKPGNDSCNFHWTLADLLNPMAAAGLTLVRLLESPASRHPVTGGIHPAVKSATMYWNGPPIPWRDFPSG